MRSFNRHTRSLQKIEVTTLVIVVVLSMMTLSKRQVEVGAAQSASEMAEKAAVWVIGQSIPDEGGYKWEFDSAENTFYQSNVQWGSAGFGKFFLTLYQTTKNSTYLDFAKGAAQWVISQAVPESGGYKWANPDDDIPSPGWWLSPSVSEIGEFLLAMYQTTGDPTYHRYAAGSATWLMEMSYWGEPGCFIPYNPPDPTGSQASHGIAPGREAHTMSFLLHMYEQTRDALYLPYVKGLAEWLISGPDKAAEGGGYKWMHGRPYGAAYYPTDPTGQVALFFYEVYQALGNATYLEHANKAMEWLIDQAIVSGDQAKWPESREEGPDTFNVLPFSGSFFGGRGMGTRVCDLFAVGYEITQNTTYLDYARRLANWIIGSTVAIQEGGAYKFPYIEGGSSFSEWQNARVYNFLSWMYNVTGEASYAKFADGALNWIIYRAEEADGGCRWRTLTYSPYYATWFGGGAAGIGYYLATSARAQLILPTASISVDPDPLTVALGGTKEASVKIRNVTDLVSWRIKLDFSSREVSAIDAWYPSGHVFEGHGILEEDPLIGQSSVQYGASLSETGWAFTGDATLCKIRFRGLALGNSTLRWDPEDTFMISSNGSTIFLEMQIVGVRVGIPSFSLKLDPRDETMKLNEGKNISIQINPSFGFDSSVELEATQVQGIAIEFKSPSILPGQTSFLLINTSWSTKQDVYFIDVIGTSPELDINNTIRFKLTVADQLAPFKLASLVLVHSPVFSGGSLDVPIEILEFRRDFDYDISLSVIDPPSGLNCSFSKNLIKPNETPNLTIHVAPNASKRGYTLSVEMSSQNFTQMTKVLIDVLPFEMSPLPELHVDAGGSVSQIVEMGEHVQTDFDGDISLRVFNASSGLSGSLSKNLIRPHETSNLTVNAQSSIQGNQFLYLEASSMNLSYELKVKLIVEAAPPPVWMTIWFWILFMVIAGIASISLVGQNHYRKQLRSKTPLDISYLDVAAKLAKLEEDWLLGKITQQEYEVTRQQYIRILEGR